MATTTSAALRPYSGTFGLREARHLLRRATISGATQANAELAVELGLAGATQRLLAPFDVGRPVNTNGDHPTLAYGADWLNTPRRRGNNENAREASVREWLLAGLLESGFSLRGRMWLFWLNHFGATTETPGRLVYDYLHKLYTLGLGDFRELVMEVTVDPQMLRFLNGNQNRAQAPNENYARELLELFTVGKGPQRGPGDYTNYTEDDVREFARALTGWQIDNGYYHEDRLPKSVFRENLHDTGEKRLSAAFGEAVIADAGEGEYAIVIETIFAQPRALDYVCRKLYRWFVDYEIDETVEAEVIRPLAELMRASSFDVGAAVRTLLQSEHFFADRHRGALAKSPIEHLADVVVGFGGSLPPKREVYLRSRTLRSMFYRMAGQGLELHKPDSVAGFVPFHQEPFFNRLWINPSSLINRKNLVDALRNYGLYLDNENRYRLDLVAYVDALDNPYDPNDLIAELAERHLPREMPYEQVSTLKEYLIPDLPDWEWTVEYGLYRANPNDEGQRAAIAGRISDLWAALCGSAEFLLY